MHRLKAMFKAISDLIVAILTGFVPDSESVPESWSANHAERV